MSMFWLCSPMCLVSHGGRFHLNRRSLHDLGKSSSSCSRGPSLRCGWFKALEKTITALARTASVIRLPHRRLTVTKCTHTHLNWSLEQQLRGIIIIIIIPQLREVDIDQSTRGRDWAPPGLLIPRAWLSDGCLARSRLGKGVSLAFLLWPVTSIVVEPLKDPGEMLQPATVRWLVGQPLRPEYSQGYVNLCICLQCHMD